MVCATQKAGVISFCNLQSEKIIEYKRLKYHAHLVSPPRVADLLQLPSTEIINSFCGSASDK
jgi:hypothetical protein